jgi:hypothetical protein
MPRECPHEKERNPLTNRCIKKCPEDNERNQKGRCIKKCPEGKIRNPSTGRCINDKTRKKSAGKKSAKSPSKKSAKSSTKKSAKSAGKKSAKSPSKKSAKTPGKKSAKSPSKKTAKSADKKSAKSPSKKSAKTPGKKSAKKAGKKMPVFTHWPIRPNEITLEEYNMFQEYNNFNPDKMIDLNLETLKDIKPFYRKLQVVLHPDRNNGVRLELFNRMQALYDKRYNNDRIYAQGENKDWKKSDV